MLSKTKKKTNFYFYSFLIFTIIGLLPGFPLSQAMRFIFSNQEGMKITNITIIAFTASLFSSKQILAQAYIDKYLSDPNLTYTTIGTSTNQIADPTDLDFKPFTNELWVVNKSTAAIGGTTVTFSNAGLSNQSSVYKKDANARHFFSLPPAIAMGDNEEFANAEEVLDANFSGGSFTGSSLWSCDPKIYAVVDNPNVSAYNGSHISMVHQSPFSMGIAFDTLHKYWLFDGQNKDICMYDFATDHGPGRDDHSKSKVHRYKEVVVTRLANVPSHMVLDRKTGWLYICEPAKNRVLRMNTKTGTKKQDLQPLNETLTECWEMQNVTWEVYISTGLSKPCGIDFADNRLLVSDNANGDIIIYNTSGSAAVEMGRIQTGQAGIMGIKIGTDGRIWYVNNTQNKVMRIDHSPMAQDASIQHITFPVQQYYCGSTISPVVTLHNNGTSTLQQCTIKYAVGNGAVSTYNWTGSLTAGATASVSLPAISVNSGYQKLMIFTVNPNNNSDQNPANDRKVHFLKISPTLYNLPFNEGFQNSTFPPSDWAYNSPADWIMSRSLATANIWSRVTTAGGMGSSTACARMDNFSGSGIAGQEDDLITPPINCSNAVGQLSLSFNVAYARYNTSTNDSLVVSVSTDCGNTWTKVYGKAGSGLATAADKTSTFTPTASQWRTETINLNTYAGEPDLKVKFHSESASGNNLFIDDIKISSTNTTGIDPLTESAPEFQVFPSPSNGQFYINLSDNSENQVLVKLMNVLGEELRPFTPAYKQDSGYSMDYSDFPTGIYMMAVMTKNKVLVKKIMIDK